MHEVIHWFIMSQTAIMKLSAIHFENTTQEQQFFQYKLKISRSCIIPLFNFTCKPMEYVLNQRKYYHLQDSTRKFVRKLYEYACAYGIHTEVAQRDFLGIQYVCAHETLLDVFIHFYLWFPLILCCPEITFASRHLKLLI